MQIIKLNLVKSFLGVIFGLFIAYYISYFIPEYVFVKGLQENSLLNFVVSFMYVVGSLVLFVYLVDLLSRIFEKYGNNGKSELKKEFKS